MISRKKEPEREMILAQGVTHRLGLKSSFNNNVLVVGAPGRGKTRQYIKSNIMQMNNNYVVVDPNGHLVQELGTMLQKEGYSVQVVNFADLTLSENYNPMHFIRKDSDVLTLLDQIVASIGESCDPFWERTASLLLSAIMFYLVKECNEDDQNLATVLKLLRCHNPKGHEDLETTLDVMMRDLEESHPDHIAAKQYRHFKTAAGSKVTECGIVANAFSYFNELITSDLEAMTSKNTVDFEKLANQKAALFVVISDTDHSKKWLIDLFFYQLFDYLCNRYSYSRSIHFFLDSFTIIGKIHYFDRTFSAFRRHLLSASIVLQDEAQLERFYGAAAARSIISNCDHYVFMGSDNMDLCEKVAQRTGKKSITGAKLRQLPRDKCVVISGRKSGIYPKYKLEKHPHYKDIIDNPLNPTMIQQKNPLLYNIFENLSHEARVQNIRATNPERQQRPARRSARFRELLKPVALDQLEPITEFEPIPEELWEQYNISKEAFFAQEGVEAPTSEDLPSEAPTEEE